jgi:uncharacterized protein YdhG (YjbR/CyaY superfamily)
MRLASKDIDEYIGLQSESTRGILSEIRRTIKRAVPEAEELISYRMPAFRFHGMLIWYAAFKNHYSIFIRPHILNVFKDELIPFESSKSKSAIKIPLNEPVPIQLVTKIVKYGAKVNLENAQLKTKGEK